MSSLNGKMWRPVPETDVDTAADEFPHRESLGGLSRRQLLQWMSASLALAGVAGCRGTFMPQRKLVPYVQQPPEMQPGEFLFYRSAVVRSGHSFGVHVATREGRPIKLEGSPDHPASLGSCDPQSVAEILDFYDPDRLPAVRLDGEDATWDAFTVAFHEELNRNGGEGVRILIGPSSSPTLRRQMEQLAAAYPGVKWHGHDPISREPMLAGSQMAFGQRVAPVYRPDEASVILLIDYDFDRPEFGAYRFASELISGRNQGRINRIYAAYATPGLASGFADHPRPMTPSQIRGLLNDLTRGSSDDVWTRALLADMAQGRALVVPGEYMLPDEIASCHALNARYKAPVEYFDSPIIPLFPLADLVGDIRAGRVRALLLSGANPAYDAPPDIDFAGAVARVPFTAAHNLREDETAQLCHWRLPATHFLEHWTDVRAFDGTASIAQPVIEPIHDARSLNSLLGAALGDERPDREIVRETWNELSDSDWHEAVRLGVVAGSAFKPVAVTPAGQAPAALQTATAASGLEVSIRPDRFLGGGAQANNGWLQELPRPITGITWGNPVHISPGTAESLGVDSGDFVRLGAAQGPVWIMPGLPDGAATVFLGYGRRTGTVATGVGFSAYPLLTTGKGMRTVANIAKVDGYSEVATIQRFNGFEDRRPIEEYHYGDHPQRQPIDAGPTLYQQTDKETAQLPDLQWGMSIDLNRCIGCGACVAACVGENNIPVVGKDQVIVGRHMHWIRVDTYYSGPRQNPRTFFQPVPCMHCETAPCEPVCPVAATVHSHEGLNQMIYNRCVGTRYCSNNCPYKVRRFNFLDYQTEEPNFRGRGMQLLRLMNNPDVTVRSRGVMEKCSYCVQRINRARIQAKEANRPIADGEVKTACQQACPTDAIVFGNIADLASRARQARDDARTYALLADLNTRPRTTYLAKLRNLNPAIQEGPNA